MSQDEVLRCLAILGGSGSHNQLADEYNKMHFPRNTNYRMLTINEVKKTLQGDMAKLLRDRLIAREYRFPTERDAYKQHRKYGFYTITNYGYKYIQQYKLLEIIKVGN